ncbi:hypothetical protein RFI_28683, partial [Reticulomyxa filosa]
QHPSDSVQCEVIRKAREKLGIKLTMKEDALLKKKASKTITIKSNVQQQAKNYSYTDATKSQRSNGNENNNGPRKSKKRTNRKKNKRKINNNQKQQNKVSDADNVFGYESCWVEISCPDQKKSLLFYITLIFKKKNKKIKIFKHSSKNYYMLRKLLNTLSLEELECTLSARLDHNTNDVGECILDFIVSNGTTYFKMKDNVTSSIDIPLCSSYILPFFSIKRSGRFNLVLHTRFGRPKTHLNYISWIGKFSALSRGCIH